MNKFTIYCTETQAKKALELGAPIEHHKLSEMMCIPEQVIKNDNIYYNTPTTEEMIGWLEEHGLNFEGSSYYMSVEIRDGDNIGIYSGTRKEATLAAIDAALEYLTKNKE